MIRLALWLREWARCYVGLHRWVPVAQLIEHGATLRPIGADLRKSVCVRCLSTKAQIGERVA